MRPCHHRIRTRSTGSSARPYKTAPLHRGTARVLGLRDDPAARRLLDLYRCRSRHRPGRRFCRRPARTTHRRRLGRPGPAHHRRARMRRRLPGIRVGRRVTAVLCDGLGHGPLAATAAAAGVTAVLDEPAGEPAALLHSSPADDRSPRRSLASCRSAARSPVRRSRQHRGVDPVRRPPENSCSPSRNRRPPGADHPPVRVRGTAGRGGHHALRRRPAVGRPPPSPASRKGIRC